MAHTDGPLYRPMVATVSLGADATFTLYPRVATGDIGRCGVIRAHAAGAHCAPLPSVMCVMQQRLPCVRTVTPSLSLYTLTGTLDATAVLEMTLARRSLVVFTGEAYAHLHGITGVEGGTRVSLTVRHVLDLAPT